jgi:hypothetical protein
VSVSIVERVDAMRAAEISESDKADALRRALCCTLRDGSDRSSAR